MNNSIFFSISWKMQITMCVTVTTKEVYFISTKKKTFSQKRFEEFEVQNLQKTSQIAIESVTHRLSLDSTNNHHFHLAENKTSSSLTSSSSFI